MILEQAECGEPASKKEESKVDKVNSRGGHGFGLGFFFPVIRMACPDIPATSHHTHNQGYQVLRSRVEHTRRDVKILQKLSSWKQQQQVQSMSHPSISRMELLSIFYPQAEIPSPLPCKVSVHDIEILKYEIWHKLPAELYIQITCWTQHLIFFFIMKQCKVQNIFLTYNVLLTVQLHGCMHAANPRAGTSRQPHDIAATNPRVSLGLDLEHPLPQK